MNTLGLYVIQKGTNGSIDLCSIRCEMILHCECYQLVLPLFRRQAKCFVNRFRP